MKDKLDLKNELKVNATITVNFVVVQGKGLMQTYWLCGKQDPLANIG
jgi:hypothetical protein